MTARCAHGVPVFEQSATSCAKCHDAALLRGLLSTYRTARRCVDEADRDKEEVEKRRLSAVRMMRANRDDIAKLMGWTSTNDGTLTEKVTALADAFPMLTNGDHDQ